MPEKDCNKFSMYIRGCDGWSSYNDDMSAGAVDIDDALKARHSVESARGTQVWASTTALAEARKPRAVVVFIVLDRFLLAWPLLPRILRRLPPRCIPIPRLWVFDLSMHDNKATAVAADSSSFGTVDVGDT